MAQTHRNVTPLRATEELVRAYFSDEAYANLVGTGGASPGAIVALQQQYSTIVSLARRQFTTLEQSLEKWRGQVQCGEVEFDQSQEEWFRGELQAFNSLVATLEETFSRFHQQRGVFLSKPRAVNALVEHKAVVKRMLDAWQPPEWEVRNERTVQWGKEQAKHLLAKLGPRE